MTGGRALPYRRAVMRRSEMGDAALAAAVGVVQVGGTYLAGRPQADRESFDVLGWALVQAGSAEPLPPSPLPRASWP